MVNNLYLLSCTIKKKLKYKNEKMIFCISKINIINDIMDKLLFYNIIFIIICSIGIYKICIYHYVILLLNHIYIFNFIKFYYIYELKFQ